MQKDFSKDAQFTRIKLVINLHSGFDIDFYNGVCEIMLAQNPRKVDIRSSLCYYDQSPQIPNLSYIGLFNYSNFSGNNNLEILFQQLNKQNCRIVSITYPMLKDQEPETELWETVKNSVESFTLSSFTFNQGILLIFK